MMPAAWSAFLAAAETYFAMYGSVESALTALRDGLDAAERKEVLTFLRQATEGNERDCRTATAINNPVMKANSFIPEANMSGVKDPCLTFYRTARAAFEGA
jgi:hypothetical protein